MDRLRVSRPRGLQQRIDTQIALGGGTGSNPDRGIGGPHVGTSGIGIGIHRHGLQLFLMTGANDAKGDFAAVGYEDAPDVHGWLWAMGYGLLVNCPRANIQ
jgi:hypothetical protein